MDLRAVGALFRDEPEDERNWLQGLRDLARERDRLAMRATVGARLRGQFAVLPVGSPGLAELRERMEQLAVSADLAGFSERGLHALVRSYAEPSFLHQIDLVSQSAAEAEQLRRCLRLFEGHTHGVVGLEAGPLLDAIAWRADLSAARLRILVGELRKLDRATIAPAQPLAPEQLELVVGLATQAPGAQARWQELYAQATERLEGFSRSSLVTAFDTQESRLIQARLTGDSRAAAISEEVYGLVPTMDSYRPIPTQHVDKSNTDRAREAVERAHLGLAEDPLNAELNYYCALATEFAWGPKAAFPFFDRYLVLREIVHYDHRTFVDRELNIYEEYSLMRVADWRPR